MYETAPGDFSICLVCYDLEIKMSAKLDEEMFKSDKPDKLMASRNEEAALKDPQQVQDQDVDLRFGNRDVDEFILENENKNTAIKTKLDLKVLNDFLATRFVIMDIEDIEPAQLNKHLADFFINIPTLYFDPDFDWSTLRKMPCCHGLEAEMCVAQKC